MIAEPTKYYRRRLWKVSCRVSRIGRRCYRFVKFYERRETVGAAWRIMHHAAFESNKPI